MPQPLSERRVKICPKNIKALPAEVGPRIQELCTDYGRASFMLYCYAHGQTFTPWEAETYMVIYAAQSLTFGSSSQDAITAEGFHPSFGKPFTPPVGAWIIKRWYAGSDGYQISVYNIQDPALAGQN